MNRLPYQKGVKMFDSLGDFIAGCCMFTFIGLALCCLAGVFGTLGFVVFLIVMAAIVVFSIIGMVS